MLRYLADQLLALLQRHCKHPPDMVAVDILEGCWDHAAVAYCRRCGAVKVTYFDAGGVPKKPWRELWPVVREEWRLPDPNLWRGVYARGVRIAMEDLDARDAAVAAASGKVVELHPELHGHGT